VQRSKTARIVTAVFGVFLIVLAIGILLAVEEPIGVGALLAALVVGLLGVDACVSAARNRRSLVERIGPLP
jgi:uncharacterized membrane protein YczE